MEIKDRGIYKLDGKLCRIYVKDRLYLIMYFDHRGACEINCRGDFFTRNGVNINMYKSHYYLSSITNSFTEIEDLNNIPLIKAIYGS